MDDELWWLSATEQRSLLRNGRLSGRELVAGHLACVEQTNPCVNAIDPSTGKRAMAEACGADDRWARGDGLGLLHGLPLVVKDTHDTAVVRPSHGSWRPLDRVPEFDEFVVQRARRAGGIVAGRAVVPECAAGSHTSNTVFGATRNPYHVSRNQEGQGPAGEGPVAAIVDLGPDPSGYRWEGP